MTRGRAGILVIVLLKATVALGQPKLQMHLRVPEILT
jgi:hypothetical protein